MYQHTRAWMLVLLLAATCTPVFAGGDVLFDTGVPRQVIFQGGETFLGWTSGNPSAAQPERWTAQPFTLPAGDWDITQLDLYYFVPTGNVVDDINWIVWSRDGQNRPEDGDMLLEGSFPELGCGPAGCPGSEDAAEIPVNFSLSGGDYYMTFFGSNATGAFTSIGWSTNADDGINFINGDGEAFMWRAEAFPSPGFGEYNLTPDILDQTPGLDPNDLYNAAFAIHGVPEPAALALLAFGASLALRRRRH